MSDISASRSTNSRACRISRLAGTGFSSILRALWTSQDDRFAFDSRSRPLGSAKRPAALPELRITPRERASPGSQSVGIPFRAPRSRMAVSRVDVVAIGNSPGEPGVMRLGKDGCGPQKAKFHRKIPWKASKSRQTWYNQNQGVLSPPETLNCCRGGSLCRSCEKTRSLAVG